MNCSNCGKQVKDGVSFCSSCGTAVDVKNNEIESMSKPKTQRSWRLPVIIGGVSLVAIIVVIAVVSVLKGSISVPITQMDNEDSGIVVSEADKVTKKMSDTEKIFTAFENTVGASSFKLSRILYDWDFFIGEDMGISGIYDGYLINAEKYVSDMGGYFSSEYREECIYSKDGTIFLKNVKDYEALDRIVDFSEPYDEDEDAMLMLNTFQDFKSGNAETFWNNNMVFESAPIMLPYRHWKIALSDLLDAYKEDTESLSFVKSYKQEGDTYQFEMYAKDFYLWYDKISDAYEIPSDVKTNYFTSDLDDFSLEIGFKIKGDYLLELSIFHTGDISGKHYKDGVQMLFSDVNSLSDKTSDAYQVISAFEQEIEAGNYKYALQQYLERYFTKNNKFAIIDEEDGVPVLIEKGHYNAIVYDGYFYKKSESYNLNNVEELIRDAEYYRAEVILDYIENGTPLPEIPAWKKAYIEYLNINGKNDYRYELVYIDNDDVPELLVHTEGMEVLILTCLNKVIQPLTWDTEPVAGGYPPSISFVEKQGIIIVGNNTSLGWWSDYYQLENGVAHKIRQYVVEYSDEYKDSSSAYYAVDGLEVTKQDFDKNREKSLLYDNLSTYCDIDSGEKLDAIIESIEDSATIQSSNVNEYILPDSDSRYLSEQDLSSLSKEQLRLARNEIYARHGLIFTKDDTKQYFGAKSWYKGTVTEVTDNMFNEYEIANRDLIISMEERGQPAFSNSDVENEVEQIREWFTNTQNSLSSYISGTVIDNGEEIESLFYEGFPVKLILKSGHNGWNYSREYYFKDQQMYFAFVFYEKEEYRLYFKDEELIRYIDSSGAVYNYGNLEPYSDIKRKVTDEVKRIYPDTLDCGA